MLYRTNSQSRLFEEAMRRYGLKYKVVGGFSFYERSEIKDLISYLKVIQNPDDSISLLRVINTPTRGIGKGTIDTLESLALETGLSLWGAVGEAISRQLLPQRALACAEELSAADSRCASDARRERSLSSWKKCPKRKGATRKLCTEARQTLASRAQTTLSEDDAAAFDPSEFENTAFDFGGAYAGCERRR